MRILVVTAAVYFFMLYAALLVHHALDLFFGHTKLEFRDWLPTQFTSGDIRSVALGLNMPMLWARVAERIITFGETTLKECPQEESTLSLDDTVDFPYP